MVDDDADVLEGARLVLEELGEEVETAASGREAIARVMRGERFDVVLCDVGMPELNGWQVAAELRELLPAADVYLVTGWAHEIAPDTRAAGSSATCSRSRCRWTGWRRSSPLPRSGRPRPPARPLPRCRRPERGLRAPDSSVMTDRVRYLDAPAAPRVRRAAFLPRGTTTDAADRLPVHVRIRHRRPPGQDRRPDLRRRARRHPRQGPARPRGRARRW